MSACARRCAASSGAGGGAAAGSSPRGRAESATSASPASPAPASTSRERFTRPPRSPPGCAPRSRATPPSLPSRVRNGPPHVAVSPHRRERTSVRSGLHGGGDLSLLLRARGLRPGLPLGDLARTGALHHQFLRGTGRGRRDLLRRLAPARGGG